jgi:predicted CoA-binding protein
MDQLAKEFLQEKQIAIVGASDNPKKFGYAAVQELKMRGFETFPVNPTAETIQGMPCYPNLSALQGKVTAVWMGVKPDKGADVLREAARIGVKKVWIQQMSETPELVALGKELGLELITGKCILMYAEPVKSFHGFHRFFVKLFGQY